MNEWAPGLNSTAADRLGKAEAHIAFLQTALDRVTAQRDNAIAELQHLERVGNVLNAKRRHP